jgi:DoxX-like family
MVSIRRWVGRVLSGLVVMFMLFDGVTKVLHVAPVVEASARLGLPEATLTAIGLLAIMSAVLYATPRTATLGAVLLTAFLGGAVATHVRVGDPLFSHTLFPVYLGIAAWGGLLLRSRTNLLVGRWDAL